LRKRLSDPIKGKVNDMKLGVMADLTISPDEEMKKIAGMGFETCQLCTPWNDEGLTDALAQKVVEASRKYNVKITSTWCGWPGPSKWNFYEGPLTLGIVPSCYRFDRMKSLCRGSDFAKKIDVPNVITHVGFIPENPNDPDYHGTVEAVRFVAEHCKRNDQYFLFETGQETPVTLLRIIDDVGTGNLGINFDPANLLLYGKANPVDALDIIGKYVRDVHAKDGEYPTNGKALGEEKPIGQGRVDFPLMIKKLKEMGYDGSLTIEREITGDQQIKDIMAAKEFLRRLI
jgi:L-ribulose-5-phosphate 3-epimerase